MVINNTPLTECIIYYNYANFQELNLDPLIHDEARCVESLCCNNALSETRGVQLIIQSK